MRNIHSDLPLFHFPTLPGHKNGHCLNAKQQVPNGNARSSIPRLPQKIQYSMVVDDFIMTFSPATQLDAISSGSYSIRFPSSPSPLRLNWLAQIQSMITLMEYYLVRCRRMRRRIGSYFRNAMISSLPRGSCDRLP